MNEELMYDIAQSLGLTYSEYQFFIHDCSNGRTEEWSEIINDNCREELCEKFKEEILCNSQ